MAFKKRTDKPTTRKRRDEAPRKRQRAMDPQDAVDVNDVEALSRFVTDYGKIMPARITGVTALQQRHIKKGVRRARNMGLMA